MFRKDIANDIADIRHAFNLVENMPLLAFSFKPRVGFSIESLREVATQVLSAGFNIVELDTRFLPLNEKILDQLIAVAGEVSDKINSHVARLSLNLSLPPDLVLEAATKMCSASAQPVIVKIDGGLNGLSAVQSLRRHRIQD